MRRYVHPGLTTSLLYLAIFFCQVSLAADQTNVIRLSTTSSAISSGLLDKLLPPFESETGLRVVVEAFGTGRALRRGRDGNADVIIVHSPQAELKFMQAGYGLKRVPLMKNEFILVGPPGDPAGIATTPGIIDAFKAIARSQSLFISRGDDSGTHKKELEIWGRCNIDPYGKWYIEYGYGMSRTLMHADKKSAYLMVDRATWLAKRAELELVLLSEGDMLLENPYHIISVNPDRHPSVNKAGARRFIEWMTSERGQDMIKSVTIDGERLFIPASEL